MSDVIDTEIISNALRDAGIERKDITLVTWFDMFKQANAYKLEWTDNGKYRSVGQYDFNPETGEDLRTEEFIESLIKGVKEILNAKD